jgi:hypothetical protein
MKKEIRKPFSWNTYLFDFNDKKVEAYDVLKYREKLVKQLKKTCKTREEFKERLFRDFQRQYWSRCEYEMILFIEDGQVYAEPWPAGPHPEEHRVNLTDRTDFNWYMFTTKMIEERGYKDETVKVDVYDQLKYREEEITDFCWNYRHKYQRAKKVAENEKENSN